MLFRKAASCPATAALFVLAMSHPVQQQSIDDIYMCMRVGFGWAHVYKTFMQLVHQLGKALLVIVSPRMSAQRNGCVVSHSCRRGFLIG